MPRVQAVLVALALLGLVACGSGVAAGGSPAEAPAAGGSSPARTAAQQTLDTVTTAVLKRDRAGFESAVSTVDPAFAVTAARIYDNLTALPLSSLAFRLQTLQRTPEADRRALLGAASTARQVSVSWRLPGDTGVAQQTLWLTFVPEGKSVRLAGIDDGPPQRAAVPLWLQESLLVRRDGPVIVLAGRQSPSTQDWVTIGRAAAGAVRTRLPEAQDRDWGGRLVIEVPSSRQAFEQVLGVTPGSYAQIAAVAWPEGPDPTAALRIVVNPLVAARLDTQALRVLIAHEATHVATRAAASPAPTWLLEGFADFVAYDSYPRTAPAAAAPLLAEVRRSGAPTALPTDAQFAPGAAALPLRYAESWQFCRFLAGRYSAVALTRFYLAVDRGDSVEHALGAEFGASPAQLVALWAGTLRAAAGHT
jgi:hypothetical protein